VVAALPGHDGNRGRGRFLDRRQTGRVVDTFVKVGLVVDFGLRRNVIGGLCADLEIGGRGLRLLDRLRHRRFQHRLDPVGDRRQHCLSRLGAAGRKRRSFAVGNFDVIVRDIGVHQLRLCDRDRGRHGHHRWPGRRSVIGVIVIEVVRGMGVLLFGRLPVRVAAMPRGGFGAPAQPNAVRAVEHTRRQRHITGATHRIALTDQHRHQHEQPEHDE
jgi:hypothetical protein